MSVAELLEDPGEAPPEAEAFYAESLRLLTESGIPFLLSGTYALTAYTGITRPTKDLDVFCKAGDYPKILAFFQQRGYRTGVEDERWIAKVWQDDLFFETDAPATQERALQAREQLAAVEIALSELPPRCREAFLLSRREGWASGRIAAHLGVSDRMVRLYLVRALEHLEAAL